MVVTIGERNARDFACAAGGGTPDLFTSILGTFGGGARQDGVSGSYGSRERTSSPAEEETAGGVLSAATDRLKELPETLQRPGMPAASGSRQRSLEVAALLLLALSVLGLVVYVVRWVRNPYG